MRTRILVALSVLFGLLLAGATPGVAQAATGVTINKITVAPIAAGTTATLKPKVSTVGKVRIVKKYFSIWNAAGTKIVNRKKVAHLSPGTYKVKTVVTYKAKKRSGGYYPKRTIKRTQIVVIAVATAACATPVDAATVAPGDTKAVVDAKLNSAGTLDSTGPEPGHEHWRYTLCGSGVQWVWVSFDNGLAGDVWVE